MPWVATSCRPPNVPGFSGEAERSEVSSAASRCWAARLEFAAEGTAKKQPVAQVEVEGHDGASVESTAREAYQLAAPRPRRAASKTSPAGTAPWRHATALKGTAAKLAVEDELDSMDARGGQPSRLEWRQAIRPPRYNHLHLGGPVKARQARNQLNSSRNATPASSWRSRQSQRKTALTTPKPGPAFTLQPCATVAACLANTSPVAQAAEAQRPRHDLDSRRCHPTRAAAHEHPLPLRPPNLYFSCFFSAR